MYENATFPKPLPPGPWVTKWRCVCGDHIEDYKDFRSGVSFGEAAQVLRDANQAEELGGKRQILDPGDPPGGRRSRGPVLWVMRVIKLQRWYDAHAACGSWDWGAWCEENPGGECDEMLAGWEGFFIEAGATEPEALTAAEAVLFGGADYMDVMAEMGLGEDDGGGLTAQEEAELDPYFEEEIPF